MKKILSNEKATISDAKVSRFSADSKKSARFFFHLLRQDNHFATE